jgi:hypothetical protein
VIVEMLHGDEEAFEKGKKEHMNRLGREVCEMLDRVRGAIDAAEDLIVERLHRAEFTELCSRGEKRVLEIQRRNGELPSHSYYQITHLTTARLDSIRQSACQALKHLSSLPDKPEDERRTVLAHARKPLMSAEVVASEVFEHIRYFPESIAGTIDILRAKIRRLTLPLSQEKREELRTILLELAHDLHGSEYGILNEISGLLEPEKPDLAELLKLIQELRNRVVN